MKNQTQTLVLLRHAHRDTLLGRTRDNGISSKGKKQAKKFTRDFLLRYSGEIPVLYSSPAKRCIQTIAVLAKQLDISVLISNQLVERQSKEKNKKKFKERVRRFLSQLRKKNRPVIIICSHGDWLPIALKALKAKRQKLKKGEWTEIKLLNELTAPRVKLPR